MKDGFHLDKVINLLEKERCSMFDELKNHNEEAALLYKIQLDNAIDCLKMCEKYQISHKTVEDIVVLPSKNTGYFSYRIMNDCETENRELWTELEINNKAVIAGHGDLLVLKRI